ncbi:MAG: hypothetical protein LKF41_08150 [Bifidobacterium sp.]|nr:hypothetical protein [Bifidobacterium sp.]MCH4175811.1 hypothetical protein [Bifidobacterium sp.]
MSNKHAIEIRLHLAHQQGLCLEGEGWSEQDSLRLRASDGRLCEPYPNFYAQRAWWDGLDPHQQCVTIIRSLSLRHPEWVFCSLSASCIYAFEHAHRLHRGLVHVATTGSVNGCHAPQLRRHHIPASQLHVNIHHGIRLTSPLRTVFDCGREYDFVTALPIVDSALARGAVLHNDLIEYCETPKRGRGRAQALKVAQAADPHSENGGESMCRAVIIEQGFEAPTLQVEIIDPIESWKHYRTDFLWELPDGRRIVGEYDGKQKYLDRDMTGDAHTGEVILEERKREQRILLAGISKIIRFDFSDIINPTYMANKLTISGIPRQHRR